MLLDAARRAGEDGQPVGVTQIFGHDFDTTGLFGLSKVDGERWAARGFPSWITLPSYQDLATGRRWHFFFAWLFVINGLVYLAYSDRERPLAAARADGRAAPPHRRRRSASICCCASRRARRRRAYNVLQKLAYFGVIVVLLPV